MILVGASIPLPTWLARLCLQAVLQKGLGHKYVRRVPTGDPKKPWRYFYNLTGKVGRFDPEQIKEGAKFKVAGGHLHVTSIKDGHAELVHDETGEKVRMRTEHLADLLEAHHGEEIERHTAREENRQKVIKDRRVNLVRSRVQRLPRGNLAIANAVADAIGHDFGGVDFKDQRVQDELAAYLPKLTLSTLAKDDSPFAGAVAALIARAGRRRTIRTWADLIEAKVGGSEDTVFDVLRQIGHAIDDEKLKRAAPPQAAINELARQAEEEHHRTSEPEDVDEHSEEGDTSFDIESFAASITVREISDIRKSLTHAKWSEIPAWMGAALLQPLAKAMGHKYLRRVPTGNPKRPWRYFYRVTGGEGLGHESELVEGAAFRVKDAGKEGHFHVLKADGDQLTIKHDESGLETIVSKEGLRALLHREHATAIEGARTQARQNVNDAMKYGSEKQRIRTYTAFKKVEAAFGPQQQKEAETKLPDKLTKTKIRIATKDPEGAEIEAEQLGNFALHRGEERGKKKSWYEVTYVPSGMRVGAGFLGKKADAVAIVEHLDQAIGRGSAAKLGDVPMDEYKRIVGAVQEFWAARKPKEAESQTAASKSPPAASSRIHLSNEDTLEAFTEKVKTAAKQVEEKKTAEGKSSDRFGDNAFISSAWKLTEGLSLEAFKKKLLEAQKKGLITLQRADLVGVMHAPDVEASETKHPVIGEFHFIESPKENEEPTGRASRREHVEVGEHVPGSRADLAKLQIHEVKDLEGLTHAEQYKVVEKDRVLEKIDAAQHRANGGGPGGLELKKWIYRAVSARPVDSEESRKRYIEGCALLSKSLAACKTAQNVNDAIKELKELALWNRKPDPSRKFVSREEAVEASKKDRIDGFGFSITQNPDRTWSPQIQAQSSEANTLLKAQLKALGPRIEKLFFGGGPYSSGSSYFQAVNSAFLADRKGWGDAETKSEPEKSKAERRQRWRQSVSELPQRHGGPRTVSKANASELSKEFGFKNVQFGNWVADADAEFHLVQAHNAMIDLADVLKIEPKQVSMNGRLAIGFGARGKGKARAHYEPDKKIINLTKFAGGGTVAHEWGHFLDNIVYEVHGPSTGTKGSAHFASTNAGVGLPPALKTAYDGLLDAVLGPGASAGRKAEALRKELNTMPVHEQWTDAGKAKIAEYRAFAKEAAKARPTQFASHAMALGKYWASTEEMFARAFEAHVQDKLEDNNRRNSYLVDGTRVLYETGVPMLDKQAEARARKDPRALKVEEELDALRSVYQLRKKEMQKPERINEAAKQYNEKLEEHRKLIADLSKGSDAQPYPQGAERKTISAAFDSLFAALREGKHLEKALAFFDDLEKAMPTNLVHNARDEEKWKRAKAAARKSNPDNFYALAVSIYENMEKGGEGSRGGKIIGHTRSGKPIYDAAHTNTLSHEHFRGWTRDDHYDAQDHHSAAADKLQHEANSVRGDSKRSRDRRLKLKGEADAHRSAVLTHSSITPDIISKAIGDDLVKSDALYQTYSSSPPSWITRYSGTPFADRAFAIEEESCEQIVALNERMRTLNLESGYNDPDAAAERCSIQVEQAAVNAEYQAAKEKLSLDFVKWLRNKAKADVVGSEVTKAMKKDDPIEKARDPLEDWLIKGGAIPEAEPRQSLEAHRPEDGDEIGGEGAGVPPPSTGGNSSELPPVAKDDELDTVGEVLPNPGRLEIKTPLTHYTRDLDFAKSLADERNARRSADADTRSHMTEQRQARTGYGDFVKAYHFGPNR